MTACECDAIGSRFDTAYAADKLAAYRHAGPAATTRALIDALRAEGVTGLTLLDIGGGIGAVQHELIASGVATATDVEASEASITACREEAQRQGHADRIVHVLGDFGSVAEEVPPADIVTLDRSLCCWPDMSHLVGGSARKATRWYGLVYPRDDWWVRLGWRVMSDVRMALRLQPMRVYVHRTRDVERLLSEHALVKHSHRTMGVWQVAIFRREMQGVHPADGWSRLGRAAAHQSSTTQASSPRTSAW